MPNTFTSIYEMTLPELGSANDTWGTLLNNNFSNTIDPQLYRKVDKKWVNGVSFTDLVFGTDHRITTSTTDGFVNLEAGDRILITGADKTANDYGRNRGEFVIQTRNSSTQITCYKIDGSTSAGFVGETAGQTIKISILPGVPERSGDALATSVHPWVVGEIKMWVGEYTNTNNGVVGLGGDNSTGSVKYNWLYCDGGAVNTYLYRDLHKVISNKFGGTAYSSGTTDKSSALTTFNLPNFTGRMPRGAGTGYEDEGIQGQPITTSGTAFQTLSVGEFGGKEKSTITTAQIPRHRHEIAEQTNLQSGNQSSSGVTIGSSGSHSHTYERNTDGSGAHGPGTFRSNSHITVNTGGSGNHSHTGHMDNHTHETTIPAHYTDYQYTESPSALTFQNPYLTVNFIIAS
ncbi:Microcystin-dependent protein (MdpB) [uncultured Mediterranean phage uvMED]|nr:Microcystin-dependent protein (MdpB) [uncultured Mediterranean phage uvMED]